VAIGASLNDGNGVRSGHVRVYSFKTEAGWTQLGSDIDGEAAYDSSGMAVSLSADGKTVATGADSNDGNGEDSGHVRVYSYNATTGWTQLGNDIDGEAAGDKSGRSVSLSDDGRTLAIGARYNEVNGTDTGHVRVYSYNAASGWMQLGEDIDGEAARDQFGWSVSLSADGKTVAIGAIRNDGNGDKSGHVRVYSYNPGNGWTQLGEDIDGEAAEDLSGRSVSLSANGRTVAIGAEQNDGNGEGSGHVRVFTYDIRTGWTQVGYDIDGEASNDHSGWSVSLSDNGRSVAIGAVHNDANEPYGVDSGHVRVYSLVECGSPMQKEFLGITLEFVRVRKLTGKEIEKFEALMEDWFEGFFRERSGPQRKIQGDSAPVAVRDMATNITVTDQDLVAGDAAEGRLYDVNTITYDQTIEYLALENALRPKQYIELPFLNLDENEEFGDMLSSNISAFRFVHTPISVPELREDRDEGGTATGAIVGIAVGAAAALGIVAGLSTMKWKKKKQEENSTEATIESNIRSSTISPQPFEPTTGDRGQLPVALPVARYRHSPTYKDSGQSVLDERQPPVLAAAVPVRSNEQITLTR